MNCLHDNPLVALPVFLVAGYLAGSIPFGVLIARARGVDLRKTGSGNVGATNVGRVLGRKWGYLCFFLDMAKGLLPTLAAVLLVRAGGEAAGGAPGQLQQAVWLAAGMGAIFGHVFNVWLGFRGGKGVATALGVVLGIWPYFTVAGLAAFGIWIVVTLISRYVSVGSIVAAVAFVALFAAFNWPPAALWPLGTFAAAMAALIIILHRANIGRLLKGTENKIGKKGPHETKA